MAQHSNLCLFHVLLDLALVSFWIIYLFHPQQGVHTQWFPPQWPFHPWLLFHWLTPNRFALCRCLDNWRQRGVLWLVGHLRRVRWQHSQRTAALCFPGKLVYKGPLLVSIEEISNIVLKNADPQVNSLSRTAWPGLLPGFWKLAEDEISHQSCDIDRELGKASAFMRPSDAKTQVLSILFSNQR